MFIRTLSVALALGAAAAALPAAAQTEVRVPIVDLDLTTKAGQKTLDRRLAVAARKACGGLPSLRNRTSLLEYRACLAAAEERYAPQRSLAVNRALEGANAKRVALLADKLGFIAIR
ncbi:MAG: UrcA family protein [Erythrobacter sp.]|jgi:UrcA family protein|nr:UrcA family protein [Erythrobacter sp.]